MCEYFILSILSLLFNIVIFLLLTLIIATITLIERKVMSLVQRRVGPNYIGHKGRLQFIADAVKLLVKHILIINNANKFLFMIIPSLILIMCYLFWINIIWAPSLSICEIEYNLLFLGILSTCFTILLFTISWISQNKYSILAAGRIVNITINLEILLNLLFLLLITIFESFSFFTIVSYQYQQLYTFFILMPVLPVLLIIFLLETGRIPFDLAEAESELIAGHTVEMGGFFFALFYLGEYFHLFCFSAVYSLILFGGWF